MSPPDVITLPPTIVNPDPPPPPPVVIPGVTPAQPTPTAKVPIGTDVEALLSLPNIRTAPYVIPIAGKAARAQVDIENAYNASLANTPVETDSEVAAAVGDDSTLSSLERTMKEKAVVDELIRQKQEKLVASTAQAISFFGRDPFIKGVEDNGAELAVAIIDNKKPGSPLEVFTAFTDSISASYSSKTLTEQIRLLSEKSTALTSNIATEQAAEDTRLAAEAEAQRVAAEAEAKRIADEAAAAEAARVAAEAEAKRIADEAAAAEAAAKRVAEAAAYKDAVSFLADTNKRILEKYGENMSKIALELQTDIAGKNIRSYAEAIATFEKISANPNIRLNAQDTQAVVDALNSLDKATLADNINRLGKAFGVVGRVAQAEKVGELTLSGYQTGDWKPLMLELESIALGMGAGAVLAVGMAFAFPAFASATAGIIIVSIAMAAVSAYLDAQKVDEINNFFLK